MSHSTDQREASGSKCPIDSAGKIRKPKKKSDFVKKASAVIDGLHGRLEHWLSADSTTPARVLDKELMSN